MKTTVELPDQLYRRLKAQAALAGKSLAAFVVDAVREKLASEIEPPIEHIGWKSVFRAARAQDVAAVQKILDEEFEQIDYEGW